MSSITFEQASLVYPGAKRPTIDKLDLDIKDSEFLAVVGPSGSGKSTTLRMISGLEPLAGGDVKINGKSMKNVPPAKRDIAMVFQTYALYPHMTVANNMAFALKMMKVDKEERAKRVAEAAEMLDLKPYLERYPKELSGGQRQRVAMGRAIVREPSVFLMDEPLSNLDARLRVATRAQIIEIQQRLGTTTIYVTHDQVEAMTMADRIAVLAEGRLQQIGSPAELYTKPGNMFVAGFLGSPSMNLLRLPVPGVNIAQAQLDRVERAGAKNLVLGVRPEALRFVDPSSPDAEIRGTVVVVENTGSDCYVRVRTGDANGEPVIVRVNPDDAPQMGDKVALAIDWAKTHWFDADTENALQTRKVGAQ